MLRFPTLISFILACYFNLALENSAVAQDPAFSQFYANPIYLNPAFVGENTCPRLALNYRNQWPGITGQYVTYSASYDQHYKPISGGLGFLITNDSEGQGVIETTRASAIYSYKMRPNRNTVIRMGFEATFFQKKLDWAQLTFPDQVHPRYGFILPSSEIPGNNVAVGADFSTGFLAYTKRWFFGVAGHHLSKPNQSLVNQSSVLPRKLTVHGGARIPLNDKSGSSTVSPGFVYMQQGDAKQLNLGINASKGPLMGGLWYRYGDAFIALIGLSTDKFSFAYSYDITVSKLSTAAGGAHEISCIYRMKCRTRPEKHTPPPCPSWH